MEVASEKVVREYREVELFLRSSADLTEGVQFFRSRKYTREMQDRLIYLISKT